MILLLAIAVVLAWTESSPVPESWPNFGQQFGARISNVVKGDDGAWDGISKAFRTIPFLNQGQIQKMVDAIKESQQPPAPPALTPNNVPSFMPPMAPILADIGNSVD